MGTRNRASWNNTTSQVTRLSHANVAAVVLCPAGVCVSVAPNSAKVAATA